ncbi:hypothetical protein A3860_04970 [Niastella vici]|uniref:Alkyl hydroperoxide reductase subunit C/ Thiol specific antioxidant domain-containing protein n=1 Tax=Niastella vici TaxID=1703345 RepID=A0A1V9FRV0_9BACT|nr:hypothetical protein [Niastella vici]OQP61072.1 hypothetical protein A3860_04970 [Niastella vici]
MKIVAIVLIIILSIVNVLLLGHIHAYKKEVSLDEKYLRDDKNILENRVIFQVKSSNDRVATTAMLKDENRNTHALSDIINNKDKFVLRFTENNCHSCVESMFRQLSEPAIGLKKEDVIILVSYSNMNSLKHLLEKYRFDGHIYNIDEKEMADNFAEKLNVPYFFVIKADGTERMAFFPEGPILYDLTEEYLKIVSETLHKQAAGSQ